MSIKNILKYGCCFTTQCCKGQCICLSRNQNIKFTYNMFIILGYILSIIMSFLFANYQNLARQFSCNQSYIDDVQQCVNNQIVWRVMFSISIVFLILGGLMFLRSELAKIINQGSWLIKGLIVFILSILFIKFIPDYLVKFQEISCYLLIIYYFLQSLIIIDGIYGIDRFFNNLAQDNINNSFLVLKAAISIICTIMAIGLNFLSFYYTIFQISLCNTILMVILFIIVMFRVFKGFNLLIWSLFSLYINVFVFLVHDETMKQNQLQEYHIVNGGQYTIQLIFSIIFLMGILTQGSNKIRTAKSSLNELLALNTNKQQQDARYVSSNKWIVYHFVMFFISFTIPMALNLSANTLISYEYSGVLMIQRGISLVLIYFVFIWSLIATKIYPQRDFSQLQNYFRQFQLN